METKFCKVCKEEKPLSQFTNHGSYKTSCEDIRAIKSKKCKKCQFLERQEKSVEIKAKETIEYHAKVLKTTPEQLRSWGITRDWVTFLFKRELALIKIGFHSCVNCEGFEESEDDKCWTEEDKGFLHLEIIDRERVKRTGVLTRSNCRVVCKNANIKKGTKDPTEYDLEVVEEFQHRKGLQLNLPHRQPLQPVLF